MNRRKLFYLFVFVFFAGPGQISSLVFGESITIKKKQQDPARENQILYNGKVWRNLFTNVKGDQFLFSKEYLPGSVTVYGKTYKNLNINYDIYNDEITTPKNNGAILQLNKEMVDSFSLIFELQTFQFKNTDEDSLPGLKGFVNVLYEGKSALYVKYRKEIDLLAVDDKYDLFFQTHKIYLVKNGIVYQLSGKSDLLKALQEDKTQIKAFMKKNGIRVSKKVPASFVPVIRYYDSLRQ
jgi:hypothetical protein